MAAAGDLTEAILSDAAFKAFAAVSAPALMRSLASEVVGQANIVFLVPLG